MKIDWKEFGKDAINGTYWVAGTYPERDFDVNDYGETVAPYTGKQLPFVALVEIEFEPGWVLDAYAIDKNVTGDFSEEYSITHYAKFELPEVPAWKKSPA